MAAPYQQASAGTYGPDGQKIGGEAGYPAPASGMFMPPPGTMYAPGPPTPPMLQTMPPLLPRSTLGCPQANMQSVPQMSSRALGGPPMQGQPALANGQQFCTPVDPPEFEERGLSPRGEKTEQSRIGQRPELLIMLVGVLAMITTSSLPILGAAILLEDPSYVFWMGVDFPIKVILLCISVTLLLAFTSYSLYKRVQQDLLDVSMVGLVAAIFSAFLGIMLVLTSLPQSRDLYVTAGRLSQGCGNSNTDSILLMDYRTVLQNIRGTPECAGRSSVESCNGWAENKYTDYLRYLETEFGCGPLCPGPAASSPYVLKLLQNVSNEHPEKHIRGARASHGGEGDSVAASSLLATAAELPIAKDKGLFSRGRAREICYPLVATRLRVLAHSFCDLMFWIGVGLILVSFLSSAGQLLSACCMARQRGKEGKERMA